ncbi:alpha-ketoglutarate-dependent dioxygenase AlkB [Synechocystis sp. PCC 7339]|uniref:alpha-ketoglutarate-dependent dioxygenase AlkB n=1 Tax=Synechocystis sp. PCC 7339 TaxID=2782213 RepID=UPI001CC0499B|nr:alpha-ketoglutarate-dependent dioxygenase AlkB [Synechocystis sp. PCC 7339]UAJ73298.1 alpha-ketoglutarate-dependent dioxygenase AlkB [Synechocystis sp. PCC 7339]
MNLTKESQQLSLFSDSNATCINLTGFQYIKNFINPEEEKSLVHVIDKNEWLQDLKRRVQHYGYKYNYKSRRINHSMYLGELPDWMDFVVERLIFNKIIEHAPNQAIVNEYLPGQGITPHIDCQSCFENTIVSLSLNSSCMMNFQSISSGENQSVLLTPRSLIVLKDDARYKWKHGIPSRKSDLWNAQKRPRDRRISITFRNVIV